MANAFWREESGITQSQQHLQIPSPAPSLRSPPEPAHPPTIPSPLSTPPQQQPAAHAPSSPTITARSKMSRQATTRVLTEAFQVLDADSDGLVTAADIRVLLSFKFPNADVSEEQIVEVIKARFPGKFVRLKKTAQVAIDFDDFCSLMIQFSGGDLEQAHTVFMDRLVGEITDAHPLSWLLRRSLAFSPSHQQQQLEPQGNVPDFGVSKKNFSARMALVHRANSTPVQIGMVLFVLVDAFCVVGELLLHSVEVHEPSICSNLGTEAGADVETLCQSIHAAESKLTDTVTVLAHISLAILCVFAVQILCVLVGVGLKFFVNPFFVVDLVIVLVAVVLEATVDVKGTGLLTLLLVWRIVRVFHAFATTFGVHQNTVSKNRVKELHHRVVLANNIMSAIESHKHRGDEVVAKIKRSSRRRKDAKTAAHNHSSLNEPQLRDCVVQMSTELQHVEELELEYVQLYHTVKTLARELEQMQEEYHAKKEKLQAKMHHPHNLSRDSV